MVCLYLLASVAPPAAAQVDQQRAQEFFEQARALCERDGGRLWGVSLCAPMVIADMRTQTFATSQPAPAGDRPRMIGFVNAPVRWGGATWGAYMWAEAGESFVRTFAYSSGPAYGLLLDASSPGWTRRVRGGDDLATLVMRALAVEPAGDAAAAAARYGGAEIRASEEQREEEREERLAALRRRFVDGPVLLVPGGSHSYDTRGADVIPGVGTVYFNSFRASEVWGTLEAEKGVLVASDGRSRRVPAPIRRDDVRSPGTAGC